MKSHILPALQLGIVDFPCPNFLNASNCIGKLEILHISHPIWQGYTQYGGVRSFGVSLLYAG